jgi:hypothetical protein
MQLLVADTAKDRGVSLELFVSRISRSGQIIPRIYVIDSLNYSWGPNPYIINVCN